MFCGANQIESQKIKFKKLNSGVHDEQMMGGFLFLWVVSGHITIYYITQKEEDSVVTLTYIYLFQECTADIDLVETELTMI